MVSELVSCEMLEIGFKRTKEALVVVDAQRHNCTIAFEVVCKLKRYLGS